MTLTFEIGKPLKRHDAYDSDLIARAFWRLSFRCGRQYATGKDAKGKEILVRHEREKDDGYQRRLRVTKPRNHVGPIIRKYNDFVFRKEAERPDEKTEAVTSLYARLLADADGKGTCLEEFMRTCTRVAQVEREAYILPDSNAPTDGAEISKAQAKEGNVRPFFRRIPPDAVLNWRDQDGVLVEAVILLTDADGNLFSKHYTATTVTDIKLSPEKDAVNGYKVLEVGDPKPHKATACPLVRLRPQFDGDDEGNEPGESQASPLAELQQAIFNSVSLLKEELFNVTFSQIVALGVTAEQVKSAEVGSNRVICIPNPGGSWDTIGADPAQADSIRKDITDESRELYRIAGISSSDPLEGPGQAESGVARAFKFNDLAANLSALADAAESAENSAMARLFEMNGETVPESAKYPDDFDSPVFSDELDATIRAIDSGMPRTMVKKIAQRFAKRNLALSDEETAKVDTELDQGPPERSANPFPFNKSQSASGSP